MNEQECKHVWGMAYDTRRRGAWVMCVECHKNLGTPEEFEQAHKRIAELEQQVSELAAVIEAARKLALYSACNSCGFAGGKSDTSGCIEKCPQGQVLRAIDALQAKGGGA